MRPTRRAISLRAAPSSACEASRSPAAKKMQSPADAPVASREARKFGVGQVLGDGAAELAVLANEHVGEAARAALLGPVLPAVERLARLRRAAGHDDGAHVVAPGRRGRASPRSTR